MEIAVDNINQSIFQYGQNIAIPNNCSLYTLSEYNEQELNILLAQQSDGLIYDATTDTLSLMPYTLPTIISSSVTTSAYKEQVMNALINNIGQTVTADTVSALLQYLGNLP